MHQPPFYLGEWQITPASNTIQRAEEQKQLEPKAMDVLLYLCQNQAEIVSSDALLTHCWANTETGDNPLHKTITQLRKALGDKASAPQYIETIRKRGYRVIATVEFPLADDLPSQVNTWQGGSPFLGLSAYNPTDTHLFFGRNHAISRLLESVSNQVTLQRAFCLILGPSGSGKSSLVNAGILPKLLDERGYNGIRVMSYTQLDFADVAQNRLYLDLASAMLDWDINDIPVFTGLSAQTLAQQLEHDIDNVISGLKNTIANTQTAAKMPQLFLFIDRLEVLLSSPLFSNDTRSHFLSVIERLATSKAVIVFSACRNDFYPLVVEQPSLMVGKAHGAHYDLTPPNRHELQQIIRLPALTANLTFSQDPHTKTPLDEILCADTANNPDALPMLQYTLQELYLQRSDNNELLHSVYEKLGGIEGAIGKKAEEVFIGLSQAQQQQLKSVLSQLVTLNPDGKTITSRAARLQALTNTSQKELVQAMVDSRLFVSHLQNQEAYFSLAHEALLRQWPRAKQWINDHKDALAIKSRLHHHTQQWLNEHKSNAYLLAPGKPLQEAVTLLNDNIFKLDDDERALITSSLKHSKTKTTIKRGTVALLCLLTCVALFMSVTSFQAQQLAQQKRQEAESLLGFMVGDFADKLRSVKRMDLLDGISNKALEYFTNQVDEPSSLFNFSSQQGEFKSRFQYAQTLEAMGEVAYSRGKTIEAFTAFENARIRLEALLKIQPNNLELLTLAGANAFWLGQLHYDKSDYAAAEPLLKKYHTYSETMYSLAPNDFNSIMELSYSHNSLGSLYIEKSDYIAAKQRFTKSLALKNKALELKPNNKNLLRDKADTISWLAKTEEKLGGFSTTVNMLENALTVVKDMTVNYPNDASLFYMSANIHMQQSYLLSYLADKRIAYQKALFANKMISNALKQDSKDNKLQLMYYRSLAQLLMLSNDKNIDPRIEEIITFLKSQSLNNIRVISIKIGLIQYFIDRNLLHKAQKLLTTLESHESYQQLIAKQAKIGDNLVLIRINLLKAKLAATSTQKDQFCLSALQEIAKTVNTNQSVLITYPKIQAYTCLNRANEIHEIKARLVKLGINNFQL
ncbi:transcriptional regulator [Pseudoalteromonas sp. Scap03]|uniref:nSTAND1 domain-containing NTPase n=1 Tax=unclassified Pseudoalteromonas TaxID=194690 RepID=UPI0015BF0A06|nr:MULTISPECIES: winged helix-turn-helix domain-containing protein [unclassified Pseudoalteromonas]NWL17667.1 transcriptional regulator [Pseudoalteromonas sp. Scap03]QLE82179.1 transcriptional regulator [Pseudoalteromonas sp. Scap25]QLE90122.1 transcriptional regulator [Pseudoalteromonas sp. Scap06]